MVDTGPDGTGFAYLQALKESGFDYAELPLAEMMALPEKTIAKLRRDLVEFQIPCGACNNFFPGTLRLTGPDADLKSAVDYARRALALAGSLGASRVVFGSGKAKNVPDGFPMERGYAQVVQLLRTIDPVAAQYGITIVIEPLRKAECNLINTFAEGCCLARDVNCDNIQVLVDFYHLTVEGESPQILREQGAQYLRHVHMANPTGRVYPRSVDEADYLPFWQALQDARYDQRVSCEAYTTDFCSSAPAARALFETLQQQVNCAAGREPLCNTVKN